MGESVTDEELSTMIKLAGVKSSDKINFKEFVDFFYKLDWLQSEGLIVYIIVLKSRDILLNLID